MKRLLTAMIGAVVLVSLWVAPALADLMDDVVKRGSLRIGVARENLIPWLGRSKSGELLGYEVDVAQDLARVLSVRPEFVQVPFSELMNSLNIGDIDVIISGYSVTAKRARAALFSNPYGSTSYWLVVDNKTLPEGAENGNYDAEGYKVGVIEKTVSEELARSMFLKAEIVPLANEDAVREALSKGEINAIVAPTPYPTFMMLRSPDRFAIGSDALFSTNQAIATRTDAWRFVNFINAWIAENQANGRLEEMQTYWFGSLQWQARLENAGQINDEAEQGDKNSKQSD